MFATYLRRELLNRRRSTLLIAIGMALAIALVIVVNAMAAGVKTAQTTALSSVYGVGTDITVTKTASTPSSTSGPQQSFKFGSGAGSNDGGKRTFGSSRLHTDFATPVFAATAVTKVAATDGVKAATGVLRLTNTSFSGSVPSQRTGTAGTPGAAPSGETGQASGPSSFGVTDTTVLGYDVKSAAVGPLTAATLVKGRTLTAADAGKDRALLDSDYATTAKKTVGSTLSLGGKTFTVVGVVKSTSASGATASNAYVPLDTAQTLASDKGEISSVYVEAASASSIATVKTALQKTLGSSMTVNTQADLASSVSGSLGTAGSLANTLGFWLSVLVLAAAFVLAVLFTIAGVGRRTREFGTLKAVGWTDRRIVGQVAGESLVQGLLGGAIGLVLGIAAIVVVNALHLSLTATTGGAAQSAAAGTPGFGRFASAAATATSIALSLPVTGTVVALAIGLALLGGLLAGIFGGWRASRLRPAEALRSVA